MILLQT